MFLYRRVTLVLNDILLYIGGGAIAVWGIAHIAPTKSILSGFGNVSRDNKLIIAMESLAEGMTLIFIGVLAMLVTGIAGSGGQAAHVVYLTSAGMLVAMAALTIATGARTPIMPYKICPFVKTGVAILFVLGALL